MAIHSPKLFFMIESHKFSKEERLTGLVLIHELFTNGASFFEYPFKVIFIDVGKETERQEKYPAQCLFSVSKRNFKKAVQRNTIKRIIREVYRKNKSPLYKHLETQNRTIALALVYTGKTIPEYGWLEVKIINIIKRLIHELNSKRPITK